MTTDDPRLPCGHPDYRTSGGRRASELDYVCPCAAGYHYIPGDPGRWEWVVSVEHPTGAPPLPSADDYGREVHGG
jgi:hypothetical protein